MTPPPGLQAERTSLAWSRTGLAAGIAALALARLASVRDESMVAVVGLVAAAVAIGSLVEGALRAERRRNWLDAPTADRALPTAAGFLVAVVGLRSVAGLALLVAP